MVSEQTRRDLARDTDLMLRELRFEHCPDLAEAIQCLVVKWINLGDPQHDTEETNCEMLAIDVE